MNWAEYVARYEQNVPELRMFDPGAAVLENEVTLIRSYELVFGVGGA